MNQIFKFALLFVLTLGFAYCDIFLLSPQVGADAPLFMSLGKCFFATLIFGWCFAKVYNESFSFLKKAN